MDGGRTGALHASYAAHEHHKVACSRLFTPPNQKKKLKGWWGGGVLQSEENAWKGWLSGVMQSLQKD